MRASTRLSLSALTLAIAGALLPLAASADAIIVINNINAAGVGFNDTTPAAPVGGNTGTTLGEQRLIAFTHAANIWGSTLDSAVPIRINARFTALSCTATGAVLGSAGATQIFAAFAGAPFQDTWYSSALADKLYGAEISDDAGSPDINANFNANLGNPGCLTGTSFYLGLDGNHGTNIDFVTTLLHEMGHGVGFQTFTSGATGARIQGIPSVADHFLLDKITGKTWYELTTDAERAASALGGDKLVWNGTHVTASVPEVLGATPRFVVNSPAAIAGPYAIGTADFGPALSFPGLTGDVAIALDASAQPTTACSPITTNVVGKVALVDRGICGFTIKVKNAQDAGAIGVIVADNQVGPAVGMSGADPTITIPSVRITQVSGNAIRAALAGDTVNVTLDVDVNVRAGADAQDRVKMFTPNPYQGGSSVSHWDTSAKRNQLMEPSISADLTQSVDVPEDLTLAMLRDIGWYADADLDGVDDDGADACPATKIRGGTVVIDGCNSGVANALFQNGCSIMDEVAKCEAAAVTHEGFTSCVTKYTNTLRKGLISAKDKSSIQRCAAKAAIP